MKLSNLLLISLLLISLFSFSVISEGPQDPSGVDNEKFTATSSDDETWKAIKIKIDRGGLRSLDEEDINNCMRIDSCKDNLLGRVTNSADSNIASDMYSKSKNTELIKAWINTEGRTTSDLLAMYNQVTLDDKRGELGGLLRGKLIDKDITGDDVQIIREIFCTSEDQEPVQGYPNVDCNNAFEGVNNFRFSKNDFQIGNYGFSNNDFKFDGDGIEVEGRVTLSRGPGNELIVQLPEKITHTVYGHTITRGADGTIEVKSEENIIEPSNYPKNIKEWIENTPYSASINITINGNSVPRPGQKSVPVSRTITINANPSSNIEISQQLFTSFKGEGYRISDSDTTFDLEEGSSVDYSPDNRFNAPVARNGVIVSKGDNIVLVANNLNVNIESGVIQGSINSGEIKKESRTTKLGDGNIDLIKENQFAFSNPDKPTYVVVESVVDDEKKTTNTFTLPRDVVYVDNHDTFKDNDAYKDKSLVTDSTNADIVSINLYNFNSDPDSTSKDLRILSTIPGPEDSTKSSKYVIATTLLNGDAGITITPTAQSGDNPAHDNIIININPFSTSPEGTSDEEKEYKKTALTIGTIDRLAFRIGYDENGEILTDEYRTGSSFNPEKPLTKDFIISVAPSEDNGQQGIDIRTFADGISGDASSIIVREYEGEDIKGHPTIVQLQSVTPPEGVRPDAEEVVGDLDQNKAAGQQEEYEEEATRTTAATNKEARMNARSMDGIIRAVNSNPDQFIGEDGTPNKEQIRLLYSRTYGHNPDSNQINLIAGLAKANNNKEVIRDSRSWFSRFVSTITLNEYLWGFGEGTQRRMQNSEETKAIENYLKASVAGDTKYQKSYEDKARWHTGNANWYDFKIDEQSTRSLGRDGKPLLYDYDYIRHANNIRGINTDGAFSIYNTKGYVSPELLEEYAR
ncbi:MAG: hypothetical protein ACMXYG_03450 [Candidatus Woesearchaeota archaeon]